MADYGAIMALVLEHRSYSAIVETVGCSRREVSLVKKTVHAHSITAAQAAGMNREQLERLFPDGRKNVSAGFAQPDFPGIVRSMKSNRHYTLQQAWHRYLQLRWGPRAEQRRCPRGLVPTDGRTFPVLVFNGMLLNPLGSDGIFRYGYRAADEP
ncbi:hypothetical protein [Paeniglutamicibacter cryotolerans]|uniref:Uncharacterized protein n=1 Tax=Paeniglutamicibacter cryotolerans TaxID=670079 RepID=A0A839QPT2_9MICC|nr:hypothetical protein [Paeniglutamicibacter cryotolerans]MBB2997613.1 hypothetical protein [Paeniglutamicibacter cryotolerans]